MLLEKTQRRLCRLLFVFGCVLPTLAVASVTVGRLRPGYSHDLLAAVSQLLGVEAACDRLATPRPGTYRLENLRLLDPSTGDLLVRCERIVFEKRDGVWRFAGDTATLTHRMNEGRWLRRLLASGLAGKGELDRIGLGKQDLATQVAIHLTSDRDQGARLQLTSSDGWKLNASGDASAAYATIETGDAGLAAEWLVATPLRWASGEGARFRGRIEVESSESSNSAQGVLEGVLATGRLDSSQLTAARGEVRIDTLHWNGSQIEKLEGRLDLREGQISRPLVYGACEWLTTPWRESLNKLWTDPSLQHFDYTQLACEIEIGPKGVTLVGGCGEVDGRPRPGEVAHAVLEHEGEALLFEPVQRPLPPQRLVQAWYPDRQAELPADHVAIELMRALPAPTEPAEDAR